MNFSPFEFSLLQLLKPKALEQNQITIKKLKHKNKIEKRGLSMNYYKADYNGRIIKLRVFTRKPAIMNIFYGQSETSFQSPIL